MPESMFISVVYATVAFFAIAFVHGFIEQNQLLLKIIGGAFVVVVGLYIFFQNPVVQIRRNRSGKVSLWRDFLSIFLFTIATARSSTSAVGRCSTAAGTPWPPPGFRAAGRCSPRHP